MRRDNSAWQSLTVTCLMLSFNHRKIIIIFIVIFLNIFLLTHEICDWRKKVSGISLLGFY